MVCDNSPNMKGAIEYLEQGIVDDSPPCLGHTVQLVVDDNNRPVPAAQLSLPVGPVQQIVPPRAQVAFIQNLLYQHN